MIQRTRRAAFNAMFVSPPHAMQSSYGLGLLLSQFRVRTPYCAAMSEENVEIVRSITADWGQGDFSSSAWAHSDIEFVAGDGTVTRGVDEAGKQWAAFLEAWEDFTTVAVDILEASDDRVLALVQFGGRGRGSGTPVTGFSGAQLFTLRDGKVVRLELFTQHADALEAAGLSDLGG